MSKDKAELALTPRQVEVLLYIAETQERIGVSPTLCEIGGYLGVHTTTARDHVHALGMRGALTSTNCGRARSISLTLAGRTFVNEQLRRTG